MPAGFHVASAYVDIHAEDAGLRSEIQNAIRGATAGADSKIKLDVDASSLRSKVEAAVKGAGANQKVKIQTDIDTAGLRAKVSSAIAAAGTNQKIKIGVNVDTAGLRSKVSAALAAAGTNQKVKVNIDVDNAGLRSKVSAAVAAAGTNQKVKINTDVDVAGLRSKISAAVAGAGTGQKVKINTDVDTGALRSKISAAVAAAGAGQRVRVGVDVDRNALATAGSALRTFGNDANRALGGGGGGRDRSILDARSGLGALSIRGLITMLSMAEPALGALIGPLKTVGVASAALVPAFLGAGVAAAALVVGTRGVGTAISASYKDATSYGQALMNLSPAAAQFAQATGGIGGALQNMKLATQEALFKDLGNQMTQMGGSALPVMTAGLAGMAGILNTGMKGAMTTLNNLAQQGTLGQMFGGLQAAFRPLQDMPGQLVNVLTKVSAAASPLLTQITSGVGNAFGNMSKSIDQSFASGQLQSNISKAGAAVKTFFTNFKDNGAVQDFMTNMKVQGPDAARNLQKIGEAGLTMLNASSGVGAAMLKVGGGLATVINAIPPSALQTLALGAATFRVIGLAGTGLNKAGAAIGTLGTAIGSLGRTAAPATAAAATGIARLGTAASSTGAAFAAGGLSATNIRAVANSAERAGVAGAAAATGVRALGTQATRTGMAFAAGGLSANNIRAVATQTQTAGVAAGAAAGGWAKFGTFAKGAGLAIVAMAVGGGALINAMRPAKPNIDALQTSLLAYSKTGKVSGEAARVLGKNFQSLAQDANVLDDKNRTLANSTVTVGGMIVKNSAKAAQAKTDFNGLGEALGGLVKSGNEVEAKSILGKMSQASGVSVDTLISKMGPLKKAFADQAIAEKAAAAMMGTFGTEAISTQKAITANNAEVKGLQGSYNALGQFQQNAIGSQVAFNQASTQAQQALGKNSNALKMQNGILNTTSPAAQAAATSLNNVAASAQQAAAAAVGKGDFAQAANIYKQARTQIEGLAKAQGLSAANAKELTNQIIPADLKKLQAADIQKTAGAITQLSTAMSKAPAGQKLFNFDPNTFASTARTALTAIGAQVKTLSNGKMQVKVDTADAQSKVKSLGTVFQALSTGAKSVKIPAADIGKVSGALEKAGMQVTKLADGKIKITAEDGASTIIEGIKGKLEGIKSTKINITAPNIPKSDTAVGKSIAAQAKEAGDPLRNIGKQTASNTAAQKQYAQSWVATGAAIKGADTSVGRSLAADAKKAGDPLKNLAKNTTEAGAAQGYLGQKLTAAGNASAAAKQRVEDWNKALAGDPAARAKMLADNKSAYDTFHKLQEAGKAPLFGGALSATGGGDAGLTKLKSAADAMKAFGGAGGKGLQVSVMISGTEQIDKLKALNDVKAKNIQVAVSISGTEQIDKLKALNEVQNKAIVVSVNISGTEQIDKLKALNEVQNKAVMVSVNISGTEQIDKLKALNEVNNKIVQVSVNISGTEQIDKLKALNEVNNKNVQVSVNISGTEQIDKLKALNEVNNKSVQVSVNISGTEQIDKLKALNEVNNKSVQVSVSISGTEQIDKLKALNEVNNKSVIVNVSISGTEQIDKLKALNQVNNKTVQVSVSVSGTEQIDKLKALNQVNNKSITVSVSVSGADQIDKLKELNKVNAKNISVNVSISGADQISKLKDLNNLPSSKTVTITVNANAGPVNQIKSAIQGISNKTVTVTVSANAGPINQIKSAISSISNKTVTVTVSANAGPINQVKSAIAGISNKTVTVNVSANAGPINALKSAIAGVTSKSVTVTATASPGQVNALKAAINSVQGKSVTVTANVNGTGAVQALVGAIAAVQSKTVTVTVNTVKTGSAATGGYMTSKSLAPGFAEGGRSYAPGGGVHGIGTATSDSILARLSNGEFVIRASMVKKYGPEFLASINHGAYNPHANQMKRWNFPGFHNGGYTRWHHESDDYYYGEGGGGRSSHHSSGGRGGSGSSSKTYGVGGAEKDEAARGNWGDQFSTGINYPKWIPPTGGGSSSGVGVALSSLYRGAHNDSVLAIQKALKSVFPEFNYSSGPGTFGPQTQKFYSMWQKSLGFKGKDADGIPGIQSLTALANRTGEFSVKNSQAVLKYVIQWGDTLTSIARKFSTSVDELVKLNHISNPDRIYAGNTLKIPGSGSIKPPPAVIPGTLPGDWNYLAPPKFSKISRRQDKTGSEDDEDGVQYKDVAEVEGAHQLAGMTTWDANHFFSNLSGTNSASLSGKIADASDTKSLAAALDDMRTVVFKAFSAGSARDGLQSYLAQGGKIELQYRKNLDDVNKALEDAKKSQDELKGSYKQLNEQIQQSIQQFASIVKTGKAGASTETMIRQLTKDAGKVTQFQQGLEALRGRGLSKDVVAQIGSAGPVDGLRTITSLMKATPEQIAKINELQAQVNSAADKAGTSAADSMYKAGLAAANGLVDGITANKTKIEEAMKQIAEAMQLAIKQALGIASPSRVMHDNGVWTIRGLIQGMQAEGKNIDEIVRALVEKITGGAGAAAGATTPGGSTTGSTAGGNGHGNWNNDGGVHIHGDWHFHVDGGSTDLNDPAECRKVAKQLGTYMMDEIREQNRKRK